MSQPHAPGGSVKWITYTYDGLGRTISTQLPDGASTTTNVYSGNQTRITDPKGKWKRFTTDALGKLVTVEEPDPANPATATLTSNYTYDWMGNLTGVSMPRGSATQTRTFVYDTAGRLTSATNPESGTVTNYHNSDGTLWYRHDAKGQDIVYSYDAAKRITQTRAFPTGKDNAVDSCQTVNYSYDSNPYATNNEAYYGAWQYTQGRLAAVQYKVCGVPSGNDSQVIEMYSYHRAGQVTKKRMHVNKPWYDDNYGWWRDSWGDVDANYTYTTWGAVAGTTVPIRAETDSWCGCNLHQVMATYTTGYDSMARPVSLTDNDPQRSTTWMQSVTYDFAGRMTGGQKRTGTAYNASCDCYVDTCATEARAYNVNGQLSSLGWNGSAIQYQYSGTENNGQITQMVDAISGETTAYQYDSLRRLITATATVTSSGAAAWRQDYTYDGFGNLTSKALNLGAPVAIPVTASTNQLTNATYDLNGNMTSGLGATMVYDAANRLKTVQLVSGGTEYYSYAPDNKRVYKRTPAAGSTFTEEWTMYGARGERLGNFTLTCNVYGSACPYVPALTRTISFAGQTIWDKGAEVRSDRQGTNRTGGAKFYPYGEEISSTTNDRTKFATYTRDGFTGLDYADQRYYAASYGRFNTADPYRASAGAGDPGSWNRYAYAGGDPINYNDPSGLARCWSTGTSQIVQDLTTVTYYVMQCMSAAETILDGFSVEAAGSLQDTVKNAERSFGVGLDNAELDNFNLLLTASVGRIKEYLKKSDCAKDFRDVSAISGKLSSIGFSNQGKLQYRTKNGQYEPPRRFDPAIARYNPITGSINLNSTINWSNPASTRGFEDGGETGINLTSANAYALGISSMTGEEFMDLTILHELSHYKGAIGNPDTGGVEKRLWDDCIK